MPGKCLNAFQGCSKDAWSLRKAVKKCVKVLEGCFKGAERFCIHLSTSTFRVLFFCNFHVCIFIQLFKSGLRIMAVKVYEPPIMSNSPKIHASCLPKFRHQVILKIDFESILVMLRKFRTSRTSNRRTTIHNRYVWAWLGSRWCNLA